MIEISIIPSIATAVAQAAIDYSKQPPRDLQIQAGGSMAVAGFLITFIVLGIFTILIKITSLIGEKFEIRKAIVEKPVIKEQHPPSTVLNEKIAAAIAVAHAYIREKRTAKVTLIPQTRHGIDPWILSERLGFSNLTFPPGPERDDIEIRKWRRN